MCGLHFSEFFTRSKNPGVMSLAYTKRGVMEKTAGVAVIFLGTLAGNGFALDLTQPEPATLRVIPASNGFDRVNRPISPDNLKAHVTVLAGDIGERHIHRPKSLQRAADYIRSTWTVQGYSVTTQDYTIDGRTWSNLEITRHGANRPDEIILIGAHYDSIVGSPGANDNGTGVAALLEMAHRFAGERPERTLRLVAFVNEEPPFFKTERMGSRVYARAARRRGDDIRAMFSLETIGYYSDAPGSQHYPPVISWFYPARGNFIAFVSNFASRALMKRSVAAFRAHSDFPLEHIATFSAVPGIDWSDHGSFRVADYPAIMVTDTAPYRYPYYHSSDDTPDKIDYPAFARVAEGLVRMILALANGE